MKFKNIFIIILILIAGVAGWSYWQKSQSVPLGVPAHKDIYYCPMHTQYISDHPGNCPICGMKLAKREESSEPTAAATDTVAGYSTVSLDIKKQQLIGVKTVPVAKRMLTKTVRAYGYVAHDLELYEAQLAYIYAWQEYYSFVVRRPVQDEFQQDWWKYHEKEPSQTRWHSNDKLKAQERLVKAEYELRHMGITDTQLQQLRKIKYGQPWIQPDLLFFDKDHSVWIYAKIFESDLGYIAVGQKAVVSIPAYKEKVEGIVRYVEDAIDPVSRTIQARIELPQYGGELKVNMYADVEFPVEFDTVLAVPREAIMDTGVNKVVFVQTRDGVFEPRTIETGLEGDGFFAVKSGLKEGETIVVSGNFLLDSESRLQASLQGAGGGHQHE